MDMNVKAKTVEEYLKRVPEPHRSTLQKVRAAVLAAVPGGEECIAWRMPCIRHNGVGLVCYADFKNHCSFFPMSTGVMDMFRDELKGYELDKGTIRFPIDKPLPAALVKRIVRARVAEADAGVKRRQGSRKRAAAKKPAAKK